MSFSTSLARHVSFERGVHKALHAEKEANGLSLVNCETAVLGTKDLMGRSKKRKREAQGPCYEFAKAGSCKFGDGCKFAHDTSITLGEVNYVRELPQRGSYINRSFWQFFAPDPVESGTSDQYVHMHPNEIAVAGLAETHPLLAPGHPLIDKIDFDVDGHDASQLCVTGKKKRGGLNCAEDTLLCKVYCVGGAVYPIFARVRAPLITINPRLLKEPNLLMEYPLTQGYVAIFQARAAGFADKLKSSLLGLEDFAKLRGLSVIDPSPTNTASSTSKSLFGQNRFER
jgi:hypothetical protein